LVEQRPEKPCVPSSSLGLATIIKEATHTVAFFIVSRASLVWVLAFISKQNQRNDNKAAITKESQSVWNNYFH